MPGPFLGNTKKSNVTYPASPAENGDYHYD